MREQPLLDKKKRKGRAVVDFSRRYEGQHGFLGCFATGDMSFSSGKTQRLTRTTLSVCYQELSHISVLTSALCRSKEPKPRVNLHTPNSCFTPYVVEFHRRNRKKRGCKHYQQLPMVHPYILHVTRRHRWFCAILETSHSAWKQ